MAHEASPSLGFSRQEYWSGLPVPSPGGLPDPGIKPRSLTLQAEALTSEPPGKPLTSLVIRKMQIRTPVRYHPLGWLLLKKKEKRKITSVGVHVEKLEYLYTAGENIKRCSHSRKEFDRSAKTFFFPTLIHFIF